MDTPTKKTAAARRLATHHFDVEPELKFVLFVDTGATDSITLLEISDSTPATGSIETFVFAPTADIPYITRIAEITPDEYEALRMNPSKLPTNWDLSTAAVFEREVP